MVSGQVRVEGPTVEYTGLGDDISTHPPHSTLHGQFTGTLLEHWNLSREMVIFL